MCSTGFPSLLACSQVSLVPSLSGRSRLKIMVPSFSSMFLLVRAGYELVESSTRLYRSSILPSSAFRPLGTYPPCSSPVSIAKSSPARSAPVWPPDMIFRSILSNSFASALQFGQLHLINALIKLVRFSEANVGNSYLELSGRLGEQCAACLLCLVDKIGTRLIQLVDHSTDQRTANQGWQRRNGIGCSRDGVERND